MAPDVVLRKLDALADSIARIETRCPTDLASLTADRDAQDVLSIVHAIRTERLADFAEFARQVRPGR